MMLPLQEILTKYNVHPKGVISVGSHWAEEHNEFVKCGIERFVYIEPCKDAFEKIVDKFLGDTKWAGGGAEDLKQQVADGFVYFMTSSEQYWLYRVACGSEEKQMPMYVSHQNQGQSNSLLKPDKHTAYHPEIVFDDAEVVKVVPLDNLPIDKTKYDFLYMDCQGFEGEVLKGATETLKHISIIMTEVNRDSTYEGNMLVGEMDEYLKGFGFVGVEEHWPSPNWGWGDKVYTKL